jgi:hypothetical protein
MRLLGKENSLVGREFANEKTSIYPIESWHLEGTTLRITVQHNVAYDIHDLVFDVRGNVLVGKILGHGWENSLILYREDQMEERMKRLKQRMQEHEEKLSVDRKP